MFIFENPAAFPSGFNYTRSAFIRINKFAKSAEAAE